MSIRSHGAFVTARIVAARIVAARLIAARPVVAQVCIAIAIAIAACVVVSAAETSSQPAVVDGAEGDAVLAGHSYHGEVFNEGPRQAAVLIPGMGSIDFPTSTKSPSAQQFIEQGVLQLHGFWYLEAERSFRQAAMEDPELAIAYWGMAMANVNNEQRARGFADEAVKRKEGSTSRREQLYIEALDRLLPNKRDDDEPNQKSDAVGDKDADKEAAKKAKQERTESYLAGMESVLDEFPDDIEAKAFIVVRLWMADGDGMKITSRYAVDAMLNEIFAKNPAHPAHHYRIHLWDRSRPMNAIESSAQCGAASPGIAHMWHMPGHIYSKLKRYSDAAWQQEASARVDHSHMIRTRLMPDEIHNFAHNNEWLVRNLVFVGRVGDALDLSRNLVSLPRHPRYNSLGKGGSYGFGRQRLLQVLSEYGLWDELLREAGGPYLSPTDDEAAQAEWLGWLAVAQFMTGDVGEGGRTLRSLQRRRLALQTKLLDLQEARSEKGDKDQARNDESDWVAEADLDEPAEAGKGATPEKIKKQLGLLQSVIARAAAAAATHRNDVKALERHLKAAELESLIEAQWLADAGELEKGIKLAEKAVKDDAAQVRPLALLVDLLWRSDRKDEALERFAKLRTVAGHADLETPMLARLTPVAEAAGVSGDWRTPDAPADDFGKRPALDELGPFRWQPYSEPSWSALTADNELTSGQEYDGRPRIVIFYLGFGCLHCIEQLHSFSPMLESFRAAGIEMVAISTESLEDLQNGIKNFDQKFEIPLLSDGEHHVFKSFRCWDDFENQPLHGTFLIDSRGRVRWQDIGYEPFNEPKFLLEEAKRLLKDEG